MIQNTRIFFLVLLILLSTHVFSIKPSKEYIKSPSDLGIKFTENQFVTVDNFNIESWHILPQGEIQRNISIIISYGDYGNMSYWLNHSMTLSSAGYDVWLYDYRGFGGSSDFTIEQDMLYYNEFKNDLDAVVKGVTAQTDNKICLFGFSMGSVVSMLYLNEANDNVDFYIGDGHICFPEQILDRYKKGLKLPTPQTSFQDLYEKNHIPFLVFQGTEDPVCTHSDIDTLKMSKKELKVIPYEGKHLHSLLVLGDSYISDINAFLTKTN